MIILAKLNILFDKTQYTIHDLIVISHIDIDIDIDSTDDGEFVINKINNWLVQYIVWDRTECEYGFFVRNLSVHGYLSMSNRYIYPSTDYMLLNAAQSKFKQLKRQILIEELLK